MENGTSTKFTEFKTQMDTLIENIKKDAEKFYEKENRAAGVRLRKGLKAIKLYVQEVSKATAAKAVTK